MSDASITKSKLFKEDIAIATGGTGAEETGTRLTSAGGVVTLTKLDLSHIPYRNFAGTPEDLLDGGQDVSIFPNNVESGGHIQAGNGLVAYGEVNFIELTPAGYVKNSVAGLLSTGSIAAADLPAAIDAAKIADGSVSNTEFQYLNGAASNIQTQINTITAGAAVQPPFALLQNRQNSGTGGGTATLGAWRIIPLNVESEDADSIVDASALPAFTLAAGTYRFEALSPFLYVGYAQTRLYNVSDAAVAVGVGGSAVIGSSCLAQAGAVNFNTLSELIGTVTIAGSKQFRLEYQTQSTQSTIGLGAPCSFGVEVYTQLKITKIA